MNTTIEIPYTESEGDWIIRLSMIEERFYEIEHFDRKSGASKKHLHLCPCCMYGSTRRKIVEALKKVSAKRVRWESYYSPDSELFGGVFRSTNEPYIFEFMG
mgnify:CR=1 FL=1